VFAGGKEVARTTGARQDPESESFVSGSVAA
jgi:hypothetical protein